MAKIRITPNSVCYSGEIPQIPCPVNDRENSPIHTVGYRQWNSLALLHRVCGRSAKNSSWNQATNIVVIFVILIIPFNLSAHSIKSAEYVNSTNVLRMVELYHLKSGNLPKSWGEVGTMIDFEKLFKNYNFKSKYGFPSQDLFFNKEGRDLKIVVMSIEGITDFTEKHDHEESYDNSLPLRLLLLVSKENTFSVVLIDEETLRRSLDISGKFLADYTGIAGKWSNSEELSEGKKNPIGHTDPSPEINRGFDSRPDLKQKIPEPKANTGEIEVKTRKWPWLFVLVAIPAIGILFLLMKAKK